MNITVVGAGYVGLSNAILFSQSCKVTAYDINEEKVRLINSRVAPFYDNEITEYFSKTNLDLTATTSVEDAFKSPDFILIATPTDFDESLNRFDTSSIESLIKTVSVKCPSVPVVIKSTVPVGFTKQMNIKYPQLQIIFSPEFLREGHALYDCLYPSRIIVGATFSAAHEYAEMFIKNAKKKNISVYFMESSEAESVKLFSNTYLAMRISFFNELDTFAVNHGLNTKSLINGICADPRIGNFYNNPSFGYGGYCLPKDTKQLRANFNDESENLISAVIETNINRKKFIVRELLKKEEAVIGVYRLSMKNGSDNFRMSAVLDIMNELKKSGSKIVIYEPNLINNDSFYDSPVICDLQKFKKISSLIVCNRYSEELDDVKNKVYTRDIFREN